MPELRQLRTFVAVAEELSFTRAAERLHLGQQAVSKSVSQLERELGVELLLRTTREVSLTAAGDALLQHGREALRSADAAFETARQVGGAQSGTVRVGVSPAIGPTEREEIVRALRDGAPDLGVSILEVRPATTAHVLRAGEVDVVVARVAGLGDNAIDHASLRETSLVLCVPEGHALAAADAPVALRALDGERLLTWSPPGTPFTDLLLVRLAALGATVVPVESRVTGGGVALTELRELDAVALVPPGAAPPPGVVVVALAEAITVPLVLLWPAGLPSPAVGRLRAALAP